MKTLLKISVLLNLALLGCLIFLVSTGKREVPSSQATTADEEMKSPGSDVRQLSSDPKLEAFSWRQLEAADYKNYISNLRAIDCPEQTIRDIITADVDALYAPRRDQLRQQFTQASGAAAQQSFEAGLQELQKEETGILVALLGPQASSRQNEVAVRPRTLRDRIKDPPIALPIALQDVSLTNLNLGQNGTKLIEDLRQSFLEQIGGPNQDPNDPDYRARWQKAQTDVNNRLEAMIGRSAYQSLQFQAQSAATSESSRAGKP